MSNTLDGIRAHPKNKAQGKNNTQNNTFSTSTISSRVSRIVGRPVMSLMSCMCAGLGGFLEFKSLRLLALVIIGLFTTCSFFFFSFLSFSFSFILYFI
jgi:hypothetical protein